MAAFFDRPKWMFLSIFDSPASVSRLSNRCVLVLDNEFLVASWANYDIIFLWRSSETLSSWWWRLMFWFWRFWLVKGMKAILQLTRHPSWLMAMLVIMKLHHTSL
jgi:hypothetical protein